MGIFSRMSNMVKAKVNTTLDNMENPIELLDQKIRDMEEQLNTAKINSAKVLGNVHEIERKLKVAQAESDDYDAKVKLALSKGNEDLAKRALSKKLDSDKKCDSLQASYNAAKIQAETIKKNLKALQDEIEKTRSYRDEAAARYSNAEARKQVNERKISQKEALANGLADLNNVDDFDSEFAKLDSTDLDAELEKYKNQ